MGTPSSKFDRNIDNWIEGGKKPWASLRHRVVNQILNRHLDAPPLAILDVGGGSARDAVPLAKQGYDVTVLDYSAEMLAEARAYAFQNGAGNHITLMHNRLHDLPDLFREPTFDLVLFNNVLQYIDDVPYALRLLGGPLKPGGLLAISSINRHSEPLRQALLWHNPERALRTLYQREVYTSTFDTVMTLYTGPELAAMLDKAGYHLLRSYGVRCVNDYISDNELKGNPLFYEKLLKLELALCDREPYLHLARFFLLIARK